MRRAVSFGTALLFALKMHRIEELYEAFLQSSGVCTDTRSGLENSIFIALKGERFDANDFLPQALAGGCSLAVCDRKTDLKDERIVLVEDGLTCLQELAAFHRKELGIPVLGITGSNGKTTTKELVAAVLSGRYKLLATRGNLNNHIGVPLTLLSLKDEELAVLEMGANHPGEIAKLAEIAAPDLGLITNVGKAHLEGFGSPDGVLRAKSELYAYLAASGGSAIVDGSDHVLVERARSCGVDCKRVGPGLELSLNIRILKQAPFLELIMETGEGEFRIPTALVGAYNLQNIKYAAALGLYYGIEPKEVARAISSYRPENQRSQFIKGARNHIVLDAYNANPTSMRKAIGDWLAYASTPRMLILGDMAELGKEAGEEHRMLVDWLGELPIDRILLAGPHFCAAGNGSDRVRVFSDRAALEQELRAAEPSAFHILVKGSRSMAMEKILPYID